MNAAVICFTQAGLQTGLKARRVLQQISMQEQIVTRLWCKKKDFQPDPDLRVCMLDQSLGDWTKERFEDSELLVFVGAAGIAVRAIASHVADKRHDPAVLCVDEKGTFVISLLSGHIGRANEMTAELAKQMEAVPVITTATDLNGAFAVDVFARANNMTISSMPLAKEVSAALLDGKSVGLVSEVPVRGFVPSKLIFPEDLMLEAYSREDFARRTEDGTSVVPGDLLADVMVRIENPVLRVKTYPDRSRKGEAGLSENASEDNPEENAADSAAENAAETSGFIKELSLIPRCLTLGVGCRRDKDPREFKAVLRSMLREAKIDLRAVKQICSIDLKADEEAIISFCREEGIPFVTFTKEELDRVPGSFTGSEFVKDTVGVDNVCERSALKGAGETGFLLVPKTAGNGVTMAAAAEPFCAAFADS